MVTSVKDYLGELPVIGNKTSLIIYVTRRYTVNIGH